MVVVVVSVLVLVEEVSFCVIYPIIYSYHPLLHLNLLLILHIQD